MKKKTIIFTLNNLKQVRKYTAYLPYVELSPNSTQLKKKHSDTFSQMHELHTRKKKPGILFRHPNGEH